MSADGEWLQLATYDRELCERLVQSDKAEGQVKNIARVLLEMSRAKDLETACLRTGVLKSRLREIRRAYLHQGLRQVLTTGFEPNHSNWKVALNREERAFCWHAVNTTGLSKGSKRRAQTLLLMEKGWTRSCIMRETGCCERTLARLLRRYQECGAEGAVNDAERCGRPVIYRKEDYIPLIHEIISQEQPATLLSWTADDLRRCLARRRKEAATMSAPTLRALIQKAGYRFRSSPGRPASAGKSAWPCMEQACQEHRGNRQSRI